MTTMEDGLEDAVQPKCPRCGTVLSELRHGYQCRSCELVYVEAIPSRE